MLRFISRLFYLFLLICIDAQAKMEVMFTPSLQCENKIEQLIDKAENTVDIAVYSINNDKLVEAIERAYDRGVKVRILTDRLQAAGKSSKVTKLYSKGINVRVHSVNKIEHNKFAIYDGAKASTGSYNWTNPASHKNSENCLFITSNKKTVQEYQDRFNYLWKINKKSESEKWFKKKLKK